MKKIFCVIAVLLVLTLFVSGCVGNDKEADEDTTVDDTTPETTEEPETEPETTDTGITQEELDQLESDLNALEAEDLGGLSDE